MTWLARPGGRTQASGVTPARRLPAHRDQPGDYEFTFVLAARQESVRVALPTTPATATVPQAAEIAFSTEDASVQGALAELQR